MAKGEKHGFIISYNSENGYGFVRGEDMEDYYFNIRAFKENAVPEVSRKVIFTLSNQPAKEGKNPAISQLSYDKNAKDEKVSVKNKDDSRVICPHCQKKIMPRMAFSNGTPIASFCPLCGGKIKQFQKFTIFIVIFIIFVILIISATFWLPFVLNFLITLGIIDKYTFRF